MSVTAEVATLFLEELARRGIPVTVADGGYQIDRDGTTVTISLENLSREFARDRDPGQITRFVDTVLCRPLIPVWLEVRPRLRWSLEPTDMSLTEALHEVVSDRVALVLVCVSPDETQITWVSPTTAASWGQTKESLLAAAAENMATLLARSQIDTLAVESHTLGMVNTEFTAFKAALVFAPDLRAVVEPVLGWPVFAVLPCRDFVYLIPDRDRELLGRIGAVVVREYAKSAYPLTTEVFEVTSAGIRAIGEFPVAPSTPDPDDADSDDGLKTIRYRGGVVVFRIPEHWEEEYEEEGGGTFYDEDADAGTFRLNTLLARSATPVTTHTAREFAEAHAAKNSGKAVDLGTGNWLAEYTVLATEDDVPLTIRYWEVINPVPPNSLRVALFSYTVRTELLDDEDPDVAEELEILDREVRASTFAAEVGA